MSVYHLTLKTCPAAHRDGDELKQDFDSLSTTALPTGWTKTLCCSLNSSNCAVIIRTVGTLRLASCSLNPTSRKRPTFAMYCAAHPVSAKTMPAVRSFIKDVHESTLHPRHPRSKAPCACPGLDRLERSASQLDRRAIRAQQILGWSPLEHKALRARSQP